MANGMAALAMGAVGLPEPSFAEDTNPALQGAGARVIEVTDFCL